MEGRKRKEQSKGQMNGIEIAFSKQQNKLGSK
jgi:hypothetical protein